MAEVERILNDRPVTHQEKHPDEFEPLTPINCFYYDRMNNLGTWVNPYKYDKRWSQAQELAEMFWKRWIKEYLPLLQERQKWLKVKRNLQPKDLVLILDERTAREQWPLGVIEEFYPDKYGNVRQALVRTTKSKFKRDNTKLCLLEGIY